MFVALLAVDRRLEYFSVTQDFRLKFLYCNYCVILAAHALEVKSNKTWEQLIKEKLFKPLGILFYCVNSQINYYNRISCFWHSFCS